MIMKRAPAAALCALVAALAPTSAGSSASEAGSTDAARNTIADTADIHAMVTNKLKAQLKDPFSAVIRFPARHHRPTVERGVSLEFYCGAVNAKNSYGAFIGFMPFIASIAHVAIEKPKPGGPNHLYHVQIAHVANDAASRRAVLTVCEKRGLKRADFLTLEEQF